MPPRGRNRANHKAANQRSERESRFSALQRLDKVIYPNNTRMYKFVRTQADNSCIVPLTPERNVRILTRKFLKTYYELFDQPGRPNLGTQYSAESFFSFSSTHPLPTAGRNLIEVRDDAQRINMLIYDRTNIATALATFPPTEHLNSCMTFDVPFYNASPMSISSIKIVVTGVFKDTSQETNPLRAFTRVFIIKHTSTDAQGEPAYQVFNDLFMLQLPTPDQIKKYHREAQAVKKQTAGQPENSSPNTGSAPSDRSKERTIQSVMAKTKMNRFGATKLLSECSWNEDNAVKVFEQVKMNAGIPQEYFTPP